MPPAQMFVESLRQNFGKLNAKARVRVNHKLNAVTLIVHWLVPFRITRMLYLSYQSNSKMHNHI